MSAQRHVEDVKEKYDDGPDSGPYDHEVILSQEMSPIVLVPLSV